MRSALLLGLGLLLLPSCGSGAPAPETPADRGGEPVRAEQADAKGSSAEEKKPAEVVDDRQVPTTCSQSGDLCLPPKAFVKRLCSGFHPDVALTMFAKDTPFTRAYLRMNVDAWNASGGASSQDKLAFDEEVLVLLARKNETGIQVSGASGSYDVLRWDGTCSTLSAEEVTMQKPPKPKAAKILWKDLGEASQDKLLENEKLATLNKDRKKECKGATMGDVSKKCVKLVDQLSDAIIAHVREGGAVPAAGKIK